ncbi:MAG: hypothetical protein A3I39_00850 [Candidatus Yanofskybacteria bacterium RIFCSPLOWO2_02_FULL_47_9b]|uniref:Uncharacterized protein n=1 Tax=Candidatus Yanofskybacteria bacterium RIFCSPLOWO2_02_FULL_47_9b TaxID=1802708 RepID=A0A1F8H843_9BACT|nr:MAG: hypothetical protein A3I39_00850 [Candidatus Yanofskybacteria bacterium RIFCSPLOWO2_02_FULL_47_9b]
MKNKKLIIACIIVIVAGILASVYYKKSDKAEIPALDNGYLQTRIDGDLYAAKGQKLERLYYSAGTIQREEVKASRVPQGDSFYSFLGAYGNRLVSAYEASPVIEIFESNRRGAIISSVYSIDLGEVGLDKIMINDGKLLYVFYTEERHTPTFYYVLDLAQESLIEKQIEREEWYQLAGIPAP